MNYQAQYEAKKLLPEQAISRIKSNDSILVTGKPLALLEALDHAKSRLDGLRLYSAKEIIEQAPIHMSAVEDYIANACRPTVLLAHCPPPDEDGYFYMGVESGGAVGAVDRGAMVIIQVNENLPLIHSDVRIHISKVDAICEQSGPVPFEDMQDALLTKEDKAIAEFVAERIPDGSTLHLGPGCLPDLVGLSLENHKDLGIHTDRFSDALLKLMKSGTVNNSKKELLPGVSVGGYFCVAADSIKSLDKNPDIVMKSLSWICNPAVISQISRVASVSEGMMVDFRGQMCPGGSGFSHTGGIGSIHDFVRGAKRSVNGLSFAVMRSTRVGADGKPVSNILPGMPEGSLVAIPRSDIHYVVTEYGVANLRDISVKLRVQALISIAHPDCRDWLADEARKNKFI